MLASQASSDYRALMWMMYDKHTRLIPILLERERDLLSGSTDDVVGFYVRYFTRDKYWRMQQDLQDVLYKSKPLNLEDSDSDADIPDDDHS